MKKIIIISSLVLVITTSVHAAELSYWSIADYDALSRGGILTNDVVSGKMKDGISRREVCEMLVNFYERLNNQKITSGENPFTDTNDEAVIKAYSVGIVSGKGANIFDPEGLITREEFSKMIFNVLNISNKECKVSERVVSETLNEFWDGYSVSQWAKQSMAACVNYGIISGTSETTINPKGQTTREQAICMINRAYNNFGEEKANFDIPVLTKCTDDGFGGKIIGWDSIDNANKYIIVIKDSEHNLIDMFETTSNQVNLYEEYEEGIYSVTICAENTDGIQTFSMANDMVVKEQLYAFIQEEVKEEEAEVKQPIYNLSLSEKEARVFPGGIAFSNAIEADRNMKTVSFPVWKLGKDGSKYSSTAKLRVNAALADDVVSIFTEIYNSGEQFPIKDVGAFNWRNTASGKLSQHSYGTCIDINSNENYYVRPNGTPIVGSFWKPYENPYSIPEDSVVVKTFAKYGWEWGGNCWGDQYAKDYMHFTYLGK